MQNDYRLYPKPENQIATTPSSELPSPSSFSPCPRLHAYYKESFNMSDDVVIKVENLFKQYRIGGAKKGYKTFKDSILMGIIKNGY